MFLKRHLLFVLMGIIVSPVFSQNRFKVGLLAGAVATDVKGMDLRDADNDFNKLGFTIGGFVQSAFTKTLTGQLEINFIQKGSMQRPDSTNNGYYNLQLNYVEVPLLIKKRIQFAVFKIPTNKFELEAGVSFAKLFYSNYTVDNSTAYLNPATINSIDVSLLGGVSYNFTKNFTFNIRYSNSIVAPIKHDAQISNVNFLPYSFNAGNNMVFHFTLKYVFGNLED